MHRWLNKNKIIYTRHLCSSTCVCSSGKAMIMVKSNSCSFAIKATICVFTNIYQTKIACRFLFCTLNNISMYYQRGIFTLNFQIDPELVRHINTHTTYHLITGRDPTKIIMFIMHLLQQPRQPPTVISWSSHHSQCIKCCEPICTYINNIHVTYFVQHIHITNFTIHTKQS